MGESTRLHHFGFVVEAIAPCIKGFQYSMNATWDGQIFEDPLQKVKVAFLAKGEQEPQIELVEPMGDASPVRKFLAEKGGGLHHVCYETDDLEAEILNYHSRKAVVVKRPRPAVAFAGRKIAWVLTKESLLVELLERTASTVAPVTGGSMDLRVLEQAVSEKGEHLPVPAEALNLADDKSASG